MPVITRPTGGGRRLEIRSHRRFEPLSPGSCGPGARRRRSAANRDELHDILDRGRRAGEPEVQVFAADALARLASKRGEHAKAHELLRAADDSPWPRMWLTAATASTPTTSERA
jgi:hypothetical protein